MLSFGKGVRAARERAGLTQAELGSMVGYSRTAISRMESSSDPRLTPRVLRQLADALHISPAALLGAAEDDEPVNRRQLLRAATGMAATAALPRGRDPGQLGEQELLAVERAVEDLRVLDQRGGGDRLRGFAQRLVSDAEHLMRGRYTSDMAKRLQGLLGEASVLAGWLAQESGDLSAATHLYSEVIAASHLADDPLLAAHACANLAFLTARAGEASRAVQCAQAGQRAALQGRGGPRLRALLAAREATGHARLGDQRAATDSASRALRAFDSSKGTDPAWVTFVTEDELVGILGHVQSRLGQHAMALRMLGQAAQMKRRPRNAVSWQLGLAEAHLAAGDPVSAAVLAASELPAVLELSSNRIRAQALELGRALEPHSGIAEVRAFREQARELGPAA